MSQLVLRLRELTPGISWFCKPAPTDHGTGLIAGDVGSSNKAMVVPSNMVLSRHRILDYLNHEKAPEVDLLSRLILSDPSSRETIENCPTSVLLLHFLLIQIILVRRGTPHNQFGAWIRSLPPSKEINAPYLWSESKVQKELTGTSIYAPCMGKLASLKKRYEAIMEDKSLLMDIAAFVADGPGKLKHPQNMVRYTADLLISFEDVMLCEEWISSRSLGSISSDKIMCPGIDLANHSDQENSAYDFETDGSIVLYTKAQPGQEICINYGSDKGAGEFLFNYGFIPDNWTSAKKATFFYNADDPKIRQIFGQKPKSSTPSKNGYDEDVSYDVILHFLQRPMQKIQFHQGHALAHDELIYLISAIEYLELVMVDRFYELHFAGKEIDLERIEYSVRSSDLFESVLQPMVREYTKSLAEYFICHMNEGKSRSRLVDLERNLLKEFET